MVHNSFGDPSFLRRVRSLVAAVHSRAPYIVDRDDLLQETIARALERHTQFAGGSSEELLAWVHQIARNVQLDWLRRAATHRRGQEAFAAQQTSSHESAGPDEKVDRADLLSRAIERLKPEQRALLRARYRAGLTFEQIARITGLSSDAVRQMHHRLVESLRKEMS
jgi:RNA polymerase sigma-70 factor (ECF subfamily)